MMPHHERLARIRGQFASSFTDCSVWRHGGPRTRCVSAEKRSRYGDGDLYARTRRRIKRELASQQTGTIAHIADTQPMS